MSNHDVKDEVSSFIREALKTRLGEPVWSGYIQRIREELDHVMVEAAKRGILPSLEDVDFRFEPDPADPTVVRFVPADLYTALVFLFLQGSLPGVSILPYRHEVGENWQDPTGGTWTFRDGQLLYCCPNPLHHINVQLHI